MNAILAKDGGGISELNLSPTAKMVLSLGENRVVEFQIGNGGSASGNSDLKTPPPKPDGFGETWRVSRFGDWSDERPPERWGLNE